MLPHKNRLHDLECRKVIETICVGKGIDIGSADRPINGGCDTLDWNNEYKPTYCCRADKIDAIGDESYDYISACHILEHLDNTIDSLKEWKRILKNNGKLGIIVPDGEGVDSSDLGDSSLTHRTLFTLKTLQLFLEYVGFKILKIQTIPRPLAYKKNPAIVAICQKINVESNNKNCFVAKHFNKENIKELCETIRPRWGELDLERDALNHLKLINIPPESKKIFEIGCGCGRLLKVLKEQGKEVSGIDASEKMVEYSKEFCPDTDINLCNGTGDINKKDGVYDFVYSIICFQHIPNIEAVKKYIKEAYRILGCGGVMFQFLKETGEKSTELKNFHSTSEIINYMNSIGYKDITSEEASCWVLIRGKKYD